MAMAAADLLVIIVDLIMRQIPIVYRQAFRFVWYVPVCNYHAFFLYAVIDCSVWFTVTFTFDRFVAICCQKLKTNYCTERTAAVVLGTVTVLSCLKNIYWYFMLGRWYRLFNEPWFCWERPNVTFSLAWGIGEFLQYLITPVMPFVLIVVFNTLTIRYVLVASRSRRRLRGPSSGESGRDPEMESRRKSLILLLVISGNFIVLWAVYAVNVVWYRLYYLIPSVGYPHPLIGELGFMLQMLSCCTNTALYVLTQTKFRQQFKQLVKSPVSLIVKCTQRRGGLGIRSHSIPSAPPAPSLPNTLRILSELVHR
ncbi:probable G-protein coupled receptor 139 [Leucoraja erinacea]|uniref:probable G-protein coupled receptor 139 n=1 Tax=Leucoraja erinaceus TaxID=7782 RepID=UPI002457724F|nr:probable G-protein coupled receptor 139 [Leucoraja erinacea]